MRTSASSRVNAALLVLPLLLFMGVFFIWPLGTVLRQAVSDTAVLQVLPATAAASTNWDRQSPPTAEMKSAFVSDLRAASDQQAVGEMVRRLNAAQPGFRSLIARTQTAVAGTAGDVNLAEVDPRWDDPKFWHAIVGALSPTTDRYLLASVDLERDASGAIARVSADKSANLPILVRTFSITLVITLTCLLIGYPYAVLLVASTGWKRKVMLAAILLPLWTSLLVRTTAWFILLQENGIINRALVALHITDGPMALIFNRTGVVVAMTHVLLPLMVLPLYSVLLNIPRNLTSAACSLGASPWRAFVEVTIPLSVRGIVSGSLLVFMSAVGYYITPALIGGPKDQMISSVIATYAMGSANWGMASALGIILLLVTLLLYTIYVRLAAQAEGGR